MRAEKRIRFAAIAACIAAGTACSSASGGSGNMVTRDSAGVRIVENSAPSWPKDQGWTVEDSPLVDIGAKGGEAAYEFDQVRGPVRLSDGRLVVANASSNEIRVFDATGKHLHTSGRAGSGPGEYQSIGGILLGAGDSLLVSDIPVRRLTVLDGDGNVGRSFSLGGMGGQFVPINGKIDFATPIGWFSDGSVVGMSMSFSIAQTRQGVYRDTMLVIRYGPDGAVKDTLGGFPGIEMEQVTLTIQGRTFPAPIAVPLGRQTTSVVHGDRFYVAQNNSWEIEVRGLDGAHSLIRADVKPTPITPADADQNRKEQLEAMEGNPALRNLPDAFKTQFKTRIEGAKYPATLPFFTALLADGEGNLWAQEATPPAQKINRFAVVDSSGRFLGRVVMPAKFQPGYIGTDAVYGIWKDEDDVEHVRGYRLRKQ